MKPRTSVRLHAGDMYEEHCTPNACRVSSIVAVENTLVTDKQASVAEREALPNSTTMWPRPTDLMMLH